MGSAETATQALGRYGEQLAEQHLTAAGMVVLARNWRCPQGELDLVVRDVDGTVVFVEVKTRAGTGFGEPAEAVGRVKARRCGCWPAAGCGRTGSRVRPTCASTWSASSGDAVRRRASPTCAGRSEPAG